MSERPPLLQLISRGLLGAAALALDAFIELLKRCTHSTISVAGLLCILGAIGVLVFIVSNEDARTIAAFAWCGGLFLLGIVLCAVQFVLYRRWNEDLI